jgi:tRNA-specific adenosine deaminase 1
VLRDAHSKAFPADKSASCSLDLVASSTTSRLNSDSKTAQISDIHNVNESTSKEPALKCASLATGMKCLPASKVPQANGNVLHDWHAEVLAIRGFNSWILEECALLAQSGSEGEGQWIESSDGTTQESQQLGPGSSPLPPFKLKPGVQIHMFCSQAPCGDASMELTMASQEDATPWANAAPSSNPDDMIGRGHFDRLGVVRRKPARPDAPVTMSKSCSDKLALKQVTGLLSGITAQLVQVDGCYLRTLVMPEAETVSEAVKRSFGREGRMKVLNDWEGTKAGHQFRPFDVRTTGRKFAYSAQGAEAGGSNLSALWTPKRQEILVNGVLQGRKQFDIRGASITSRRGLWKLALEVAAMAGVPAVLDNLNKATYGQAKGTANPHWTEAKDKALEKALTGWKRNERDDDWGLEARQCQ